MAAVSLLTLGWAGCLVAHEDAPPLGAATFRWSIAERFVPADCYMRGAATMQVFVFDQHGAYLEQTNASCAAFSTSTALNVGWYSATMQLVDANGAAVSTALDTGLFSVTSSTDTLVDTDYPADSFY